MCQKEKKSVKPNANGPARDRRAEILDRHLGGQKPLTDQNFSQCYEHAPQPIGESRTEKAARYEEMQKKLYGTEIQSRYGNDHKKEPEELPEGIKKEDLRNRGLRYMGTDNFSDGRVVYLFTMSEADKKDWGTVLAVKPVERGILRALDEKLDEKRKSA